LEGLTSLSDPAAEILSGCKADLRLSGLRTLSDAAAESLSKHTRNLFLEGLTELSDAAAKSLAKKHKLCLPYQGNALGGSEEIERLVEKYR
jgi:hypothetical protein